MLVKVACDARGCYFEEDYAVSDNETTNELKKRMEANGWTIIGEDHFCPNYHRSCGWCHPTKRKRSKEEIKERR